MRSVVFWWGKRTPAQVHRAAAARLCLNVDETRMEVLARGEPVDISYYLEEREIWQLAGLAEVVRLSPALAPGVRQAPLLRPLTLSSCHLCPPFRYHLGVLLPMLAMQLAVAP